MNCITLKFIKRKGALIFKVVFVRIAAQNFFISFGTLFGQQGCKMKLYKNGYSRDAFYIIFFPTILTFAAADSNTCPGK